jgi:hypothetical protein
MGVHAPAMVTKIRLRVSDLQGTKYSDYEVLSALNDARTMLWIAMAENFSTIPRRRVQLTLTDGQALLPEDYYSLAEKPCGVEIEGFHAVRTRPDGRTAGAGEDVITLIYNGLPLPSEDLDYIVPGTPLFEVHAIDDGDGAEIVYNGYSFPAEEDGSYMFTTPLSLVMDVVEIAAYVLAGNNAAAAETAQNSARRVSQKREWGAVPNLRPIP